MSWTVAVLGRGLSGLGSCTAQMTVLAVFINPSHPWQPVCGARAWRTVVATIVPTTVVKSAVQERRPHRARVRWVKRRIRPRLAEFVYAAVTCRFVYRWVDDEPAVLDRVRHVLAQFRFRAMTDPGIDPLLHPSKLTQGVPNPPNEMNC
ncbi:hypothetical protein B7755_043720 [Streptomyces sp. NBS 14/10]|uniref:hypothetical protein n=1 Tax=Streptomyces sp. NBS 14/10 TaxID=1945643 RepID=UPI000B7F7DA1|nr:hypothetical protein [Streptomyces sp. NBS 14/10]KAK1184407.1 hypothetical protein B7755_043720 [Streptomyces sp. NBS 14/10]